LWIGWTRAKKNALIEIENPNWNFFNDEILQNRPKKKLSSKHSEESPGDGSKLNTATNMN